MLFWKITKGMIAVCTNQELLGCTLKVTRANLMNGLSWNATFQNPVTYLSHKGIEIHSHFILRGDSTLASAHVALWWKTKVMCEWFPGACRLSYAHDLYCWGTLLRDNQWAKARTRLLWFAQRLRRCRRLCPRVLRCLPSSLWPLSSFGRAVPKVSFGVTEHGNCWLLVWLSLKFTCSVPALIFSLFSNGCEYQANV